MTSTDICKRMAEARGGDVIIRIENTEARRPEEAAHLFGLRATPEAYHEVPRQEARAVLVNVLARDMAYRCPLVPLAEAEWLADAFLAAPGSGPSRFFTNGDFGQPRSRDGHGPGWYPVTDATFDTGVLVLAEGRTACAWFMDED